MKIKCGQSKRERNNNRLNAVRNWHPCFAWLPIRVGDGVCVWLEWIERKYPSAWVGEISGNLYYNEVIYRLPQPSSGEQK